jgi:uncharacterized protein YbjT (DUF2867 family)
LRRLGARVVAGDLSQAETLVPHPKDVDGVFSVQNYWERGVGADGEVRQAENLDQLRAWLGDPITFEDFLRQHQVKNL